MSEAGIFPWQQEQWQRLFDAREQGRLPHALLLRGPRGMGKALFARRFATGMLCTRPDEQGLACGSCASCLLTAADSHPDLNRVVPIDDKPEKKRHPDSLAITVDQIRELIHHLNLSSQYGGAKLVIIEPADQMNVNAANSLLKTLEEPPADTVMLLVSHNPQRLPVTVRSRCQDVEFRPGSRRQALDWLRRQGRLAENAEPLLDMARGAPLRALRLEEENWPALREAVLATLLSLRDGKLGAVAGAAEWLGQGSRRTLPCLVDLLSDLIRLKQGGDGNALTNPDLFQPLQGLARKVEPGLLYGMYDLCMGAHRDLEGGRNFNEQCVLDEIALHWCL